MLYKGKVIDNRPNDPLWRMTVQVPGLFGDSQVEAWPMLVSNTLQHRPDNGSGVWVMESDGDTAVWMGQWATAGTDVDALLNHGHDQFLTNVTHDITARHTFGAALGTPAAGADIATAGAAGSGASPARSDHTHKVGSGAINSSGMFFAGVVGTSALASGSVTTVKLGSDVASTISTIQSNISTNTSNISTNTSNISSNTSNISSLSSTVSSLSSTVSGLSSTVSGLKLVTMGSAVATTDGSGIADFSYGQTFGFVPRPVIAIGDSTIDAYQIRDGNNTSSSFNVRCKAWTGSALAVAASTAVRFNWIVQSP